MNKIERALTFKYDRTAFFLKDGKVNCSGLVCFFSEPFNKYCKEIFNNSENWLRAKKVETDILDYDFVPIDISEATYGDIILIKADKSRFFTHTGFFINEYDIIHAKDENSNVCITDVLTFITGVDEVLVLRYIGKERE